MPCAIDPYMVVFRGITLTGFWLVNFLGTMTGGERASLFAGLAERIASGELHVDVEAVYPIEEIKTALEHAARGGRDGKILVTANGPLSS